MIIKRQIVWPEAIINGSTDMMKVTKVIKAKKVNRVIKVTRLPNS